MNNLGRTIWQGNWGWAVWAGHSGQDNVAGQAVLGSLDRTAGAKRASTWVKTDLTRAEKGLKKCLNKA